MTGDEVMPRLGQENIAAMSLQPFSAGPAVPTPHRMVIIILRMPVVLLD